MLPMSMWKLPLTPNLKVKLVNGASSSDIRSIKVFYPSPKVDDMDDESYGDFSGDLPHCWCKMKSYSLGKNLKKLKMRKFFILWYLCQSWSNSETNVSHNVKFDARPVLFSWLFQFHEKSSQKHNFSLFALISHEKNVKF